MKNIFILLLPLVYLLYNYSIVDNKSISDNLDLLHNFVLFEFIVIGFIVYKRNKENIKKLILNNLSLFILWLLLVVVKLYLLYITEITIDIIYLFKIFLSVTLDILPLLLLRPLINKKYLYYIYTVLYIIVFLSNILTSYYYYNTFEIVEPLIFDNLNFTSLMGILQNGNIIYLIFLSILFLLISIIIIYKYDKKKKLNYSLYLKKFSLILLIIFLLENIFFYGEKFTASKIFVLYGYERKQQDILVNKITTNSLYSILRAYYLYYNNFNIPQSTQHNFAFNNYEISELKKLGLYIKKPNKKRFIKKYNRIIMLELESFSMDFINFYNHKIPKEATSYLNYLLSNYFHIDNYYTSNMPTDYGLTSIFKSKLDLNSNGESIFSILKKSDYLTIQINAISKFYGIMNKYYPKAFKFDKWIYKEKLVEEYGKKYSGWGFHNDVLYDKAIKILNENKSTKVFVSIKTIDFHQPGCYHPNSKDFKLPNKLKNTDRVIKSIYWIDKSLQNFISKLSANKLFDDKTLIIITADHNPHPGANYKKYSIKDNYRRLAKIPLIFITKYHDFRFANKYKNKLTSQVDLLPTILSILDINYNSNSLFGNNIFVDNSFAYLGKYKNILLYKNNKNSMSLKCNLSKEKESKECLLIKKYFYKIQEEYR